MKVWKIILSLLLVTIISLPSMAENVRWKKNLLFYYVQEDEYAPMMKNAFAEWQKQLRHKIQFYVSKNTKPILVKEDIALSDITVTFERVEGEDAKNEGITTLTKNHTGAIIHANIVIKIKQDEELEKDDAAKENNEKELNIIMMHQVGEALGLSNSENPDSVMYEEIGLNQTILREDINRLLDQYGIPYNKSIYAK